ncbi:hypothetical protein vBSsoS008_036 [Shigella phage vB_SsoS_008]|nr:hypothetical protein vBSsoS008_036 [Shigella phage vB_SsoS_008]
MTLPASALELPGLRCLIAREEIEVKDDSATNRKIRAEMAKPEKPDPWDSKSVISQRTAANINHQGAHVAPFFCGEIMNQETLISVVEQVRKLVPALRKVPDETLYAWVEMAELFVCHKTFKDAYVKALALYALPYLAFLDVMIKGEDEDLESYSRRVTSFSLSGEFSQTFGEVTKNQSGNMMLSNINVKRRGVRCLNNLKRDAVVGSH